MIAVVDVNSVSDLDVRVLAVGKSSRGASSDPKKAVVACTEILHESDRLGLARALRVMAVHAFMLQAKYGVKANCPKGAESVLPMVGNCATYVSPDNKN